MDLKGYFEGLKGTGVMATADMEGHAGMAIYAKPHVMEDGTVAFIMADRLMHHNLQINSHAAYLFKEDAPGYKGIRLYLTKLREEKNTEFLYSLRREKRPPVKEGEPRFLVTFRVDKILPLIGPGRDPEEA